MSAEHNNGPMRAVSVIMVFMHNMGVLNRFQGKKKQVADKGSGSHFPSLITFSMISGYTLLYEQNKNSKSFLVCFCQGLYK